jgi:hypothetical protein
MFSANKFASLRQLFRILGAALTNATQCTSCKCDSSWVIPSTKAWPSREEGGRASPIFDNLSGNDRLRST